MGLKAFQGTGFSWKRTGESDEALLTRAESMANGLSVASTQGSLTQGSPGALEIVEALSLIHI